MASDIKSEVLQLVQAIDDEQLLQLLKADIEYFTEKDLDITDDLQPSEKEELRALANEPDTFDTLSEEEFINATAKWRTR
jgi:hypothetical protein